MSGVIGIDGGQSEIRARFADRTEIRRVAGASRLDDDLIEPILDVVERVLSLDPDRPIGRVVAGLTALPLGSRRGELVSLLLDITGADEVWLGDDSATAHAGALQGRTGVVLAVGTGAVALAVDTTARRFRSFDGAGFLLGDEGGGFWIGRHTIRAAMRAVEGRGPSTALQGLIADTYGGFDSLADRLHSHPRAVDSIAQAAPIALEAAANGDDVAAQIVGDAADRLASTAIAAAASLGPLADLAFTGRLVAPDQPLRRLVEERLSARSADVRVVESAGSSLDGACRIASGLDLELYRTQFHVTRNSP